MLEAIRAVWFVASHPDAAQRAESGALGRPHMTLVLRVIAESVGNDMALVADIIAAVSTVVLNHPRWVNLGLQFIESFDRISLLEVRDMAKATKARPLHSAVATLLAIRLAEILGPSKLPKPKREKREPKPSRLVMQLPMVRENIATGVELLVRSATAKTKREVGRQRRQLGIGARRQVYSRGQGLRRPRRHRNATALAGIGRARQAPTSLRQQLEQRVLGGKRLTAKEIRMARRTPSQANRKAA